MTAYIVTTAILFVLGAGMELKSEQPSIATVLTQIGLATWGLWLVLR